MGGPIRILHVVVNMNRGGAETLIMNLYRNIDRSKIQFDFLTCKEGVYNSEINQMGGEIYQIPYITDVGHFRYIKELNEFFITHRDYKIVHSHMDKMSGLVLRSAKLASIPIRIAHSHSTRSEGGIAANLYKWYAGKLIIPNATHLLACSNTASRWLFKGMNNLTKIIKNGIDCNRFKFSPEVKSQIREELNITEDSFVVGHVGRFSQPKNHSFLIDVFAELIKIRPHSVLILAGEGPLQSGIKKKVMELNLVDKVRFLGVRSDIDRLLQALDIFVFPSLYEGLPVTLIEAQAVGVPCMIANTITPEVDMSSGLIHFLPLNNPRHWATEIIMKMQPSFKNYQQAIKNKGYDIRESSRDIESYYLSLG